MKHKLIFSIAIALASCNALAVGRLASIDLYDRHEQVSLPVYWQHGKAWVEGRPGNEYRIRIRNQAGQDVLAVVSVDGVNVVTGATAHAQQGGYVIDAWQDLDIEGWRTGLAHTAAFHFTSIADSYAARTGRPDNVGVIGVAMFRRKAAQAYAPPPASIAPLASGVGAHDRDDAAAQSAPMRAQEKSLRDQRADRLGTGYGRHEFSPARMTSFDKATAAPEEVVTIYYDSRENLIARGVIRDRSQPWREPQAFPGPFVPAPPR